MSGGETATHLSVRTHSDVVIVNCAGRSLSTRYHIITYTVIRFNNNNKPRAYRYNTSYYYYYYLYTRDIILYCNIVIRIIIIMHGRKKIIKNNSSRVLLGRWWRGKGINRVCRVCVCVCTSRDDDGKKREERVDIRPPGRHRRIISRLITSS